MAGEQREAPLSTVAVISSGKRPVRVFKEPTSDCLIPVIGRGGPSGYTDSALFDGGVLITGRVGTLGKLFAPAGPCWPSDNALVVRPSSAETEVQFLRYALQHVIANAAGMNRGAANPLITQGDLGRLRISHPSIDEQHAIAHILGSLDDKIELNRRMNETLEAIARAIFKSWFVDFDPVRAKASGEPPESICRRLRLTPDLLALFPDRLVDSELGQIPQGWRVSTLAGEAHRCGGFIQTGPFGSQLHAADYVAAGVPVVMPQDLVNRGVSLKRIARVNEEMAARLSRHRLHAGDVVYSRRGDVQRHALIGERESGWLCGTGCLLVRLGDAWLSSAYLSEALDLDVTRRWLVQHAVGATMPNLNTSILGAVTVLVPPDSLLSRFETIVRPLRSALDAARAQSGCLSEIRDALLPKLLSGELRVPLEDAARTSP